MATIESLDRRKPVVSQGFYVGLRSCLAIEGATILVFAVGLYFFWSK